MTKTPKKTPRTVLPGARLNRHKAVLDELRQPMELALRTGNLRGPVRSAPKGKGVVKPHVAASRLIKHRNRMNALLHTVDGELKDQSTPIPGHLIDLPPDGVLDMEATAVSIAAPAAQQLDTDTIEAIRERVRRICEAGNGYSQSRVAKESQISSTTLSQFLGGIYQGNVSTIASKVRQWLEIHDERAKGEELPTVPRWVETPTSRRIIGDIRYAHLAADLILIVGSAGIGKSKALAHYASITPNAWHIEMSAATGSLIAALEHIAIELGVREYARTPAYLQRAIAAKIRATGGLLMIDEAQHLTVQALDQIRWFNDTCEVGLVLSGNDRVYTQMTGGNRAAYLDRLYSRVGKRTHIKRVTAGDADAIIKAWGIDAINRDTIRDIANRPGALRVLNKVLRLAATYAQAKGKKISTEEIAGAARELGVFE